ncbi:MAG TPA: hypothetical protein VHE61_15295 [Opitutaceae bacterium]|nr:hypothetical protein [Opitutaceae bacterium]
MTKPTKENFGTDAIGRLRANHSHLRKLLIGNPKAREASPDINYEGGENTPMRCGFVGKLPQSATGALRVSGDAIAGSLNTMSGH